MTSPLGAQWDAAYARVPPWDIGRAQSAIMALAEGESLTGRIIELGCGTGENLLALAGHATVVGVDISRRAIRQARAKAAHRGLDARFEVADILDAASLPDDLTASFDVLIDSGTFHMFGPADRGRYAQTATGLVTVGGRAHVLSARFDPTRTWGPAGVEPEDVAAAFGRCWRVLTVKPAVFEMTHQAPVPEMPAALITLDRTGTEDQVVRNPAVSSATGAGASSTPVVRRSHPIG